MNKLIILLFANIFFSYSYSQSISKSDSLGLPGDNLNLYAVLDLFQNSKTFESFEKKLNEVDSKINNLDLNNDGKTDYIKVIDHKDGETHSIILQTPITENENQDIAVIEIEKDKDSDIKVQIIGNEDLYGKDYIVEPQENDSTQNSGGTINPAAKKNNTVIINNTTNNYNNGNGNNRTYVAVRYWPMWGYMYAPNYSIYVSPWHWNNYPTWWQPWTPWQWHRYYWHQHNYHNHYNHYYHRTAMYRNERAQYNYSPRKSSSELVRKNHRDGVYLKSYNSAKKNNPIEKKSIDTNPAYKEKRVINSTEQPVNNTNRANHVSPKKVESNSQPGNKNQTKQIRNFNQVKQQPVKQQLNHRRKPVSQNPKQRVKQQNSGLKKNK